MLASKKYQKVNIEISNICNLQCSFCPEVIRSKKLIDLDLFREIIAQVAPLTELVCFHLMGDPLVHPKLSELIEICHEFKVRIFFVTNGVLLKEKQAELLLHPAMKQVNFSLHSFFDNFPEKDPTAYLERIFQFTEAAFEKRPDLYLNYRLWNLSEARGTSDKNLLMLQKISERFLASNDSIKDSAKLAAVDVRVQKSKHLKNKLYLHYDTEFIWPSLSLPVLGTQGMCYGLKSHFGILVDGTVVPCCLDKEGEIPLGKIQESSLSDILNSPRSQALLRGFRSKKLVESLCQRCQYIERFA